MQSTYPALNYTETSLSLVDVHDGIVTSLVGYNSIVVYAGDDID